MCSWQSSHNHLFDRKLQLFFQVIYNIHTAYKNKPERVFGLQVRCRELDIFKILEIVWEIVWKFFWFFGEIFSRIFRGDFFWRIFFGGIFSKISDSILKMILVQGLHRSSCLRLGLSLLIHFYCCFKQSFWFQYPYIYFLWCITMEYWLWFSWSKYSLRDNRYQVLDLP